MDRLPEQGCSLWRVLFEERTSHSVEVTSEFPFVAKDSPEVSELRWGILRQRLSDADLAEVAHFCENHGRLVWLRSAVETLVRERPLLQRAKGLTLASFASFSESDFEFWVDCASVGGTWVAEQIVRLRKNVGSNALAQHWYRRFLNSRDPDEWWAAFQLVLLCGDERFWFWRSELESQANAPDLATKMAYIAVNGKDIQKDLAREGERKKTFCGFDVERTEIFPFCGPRNS